MKIKNLPRVGKKNSSASRNADTTVANIHKLLVKETRGGLEAHKFRDRYLKKFGSKPFPDNVKLKKNLQKFPILGKFQLETKRQSSFWIVLPSANR